MKKIFLMYLFGLTLPLDVVKSFHSNGMPEVVFTYKGTSKLELSKTTEYYLDGTKRHEYFYSNGLLKRQQGYDKKGKKISAKKINFIDAQNEAEIQIKNLLRSAVNFYTWNGRMPSDCYEEMEQYGAIEMKQSVIDSWEFQCDWIFDEYEMKISGTVTVTSTESNNAGSGIVVEYDMLTGEFDAFIKNKIK